MIVLWSVLGGGFVLGLALWLRQRHEHGWNGTLGFVSRQWIEEHRLAETSDHA